VLAGNVANVDTPGYKPIDVERATPAELAAGELARTHEGHIASPAAAGGGLTQVFDDAGQMQSADGNAVNLERELAKIEANRVRYATSADLVSRRLALLRYAAGDGAL
jgi:flagellar basal-body rod protein FlgB